jgi:hypothetical protein
LAKEVKGKESKVEGLKLTSAERDRRVRFFCGRGSARSSAQDPGPAAQPITCQIILIICTKHAPGLKSGAGPEWLNKILYESGRIIGKTLKIFLELKPRNKFLRTSETEKNPAAQNLAILTNSIVY